jgi:methylmalonyl-CoA mutase N-terminal domain/subunit
MARRIVAEMERIDGLGGIVKCIENGYIQQTVAKQAYEEEKAIRSGEKVKVGVNKYRSEEKSAREVELHELDPRVREEQIARLSKVKAERDDAAVAAALDKLRDKAANTDENLMPHLMDCIRAYATVGEMSKVFVEVFGEFREPSIF